MAADDGPGRDPISRFHHYDLYALAAVAQPVVARDVRPDEVVHHAGLELPIEETNQLEGDPVSGVARDQVPLRPERPADRRVGRAPLDPDAVAAVAKGLQPIEVRPDPTARDLVPPGPWGAGARDEDAVRRLNAIVHPAVRVESAARFAAALAADPSAVVVYDVPLLLEARAEDPWQLVVVAHAPVGLRRERLVSLRGMSPADADARIASQVDDERRLAIADVVIDTSGSMAQTLSQVDALWERLAG